MADLDDYDNLLKVADAAADLVLYRQEYDNEWDREYYWDELKRTLMQAGYELN